MRKELLHTEQNRLDLETEKMALLEKYKFLEAEKERVGIAYSIFFVILNSSSSNPWTNLAGTRARQRRSRTKRAQRPTRKHSTQKGCSQWRTNETSTSNWASQRGECSSEQTLGRSGEGMRRETGLVLSWFKIQFAHCHLSLINELIRLCSKATKKKLLICKSWMRYSRMIRNPWRRLYSKHKTILKLPKSNERLWKRTLKIYWPDRFIIPLPSSP